MGKIDPCHIYLRGLSGQDLDRSVASSRLSCCATLSATRFSAYIVWPLAI